MGARTRVTVDYVLPEKIDVKFGLLHGSVLSPFLLTLVVDAVTESTK